MLGEAARRAVRRVSRASIGHGLRCGTPLRVEPSDYARDLRAHGACFVTLRRAGELRGCVGSLDPHRPLVVDVSENAYAAAFCDPRFPPLTEKELARLEVHVTRLGPARPLAVASERELLAALEPGRDGLILELYGRRATFLPAVWEQLPEPAQFVAALKRKAGLPAGYWSPAMELWRYQTESIG